MNVALLGFGVVGKGVYDLLVNDHPDIEVKYILERNDDLLTNLMHLKAPDFDTIIHDESVDVVIELIGGKGVAYTFVKAALSAGKHVVTANKALISDYYEPLHELAKEKGVNLLFEASVGGAMIVLDPLRTIQDANPIHHIEGIINGSTNYVLTKVFLGNKAFSETIDEAFELGYLEKGSTDDMDGLDLMRKINILSMLSYQTVIPEKDILNMPLSRMSEALIEDVKSHGFILKYVAYSDLKDDQIAIYLVPTILDKHHLYSHVNNEYNIVDLYGKYHQKQSFVGQGAGRYPTASAVVYDVMHVKRTYDVRYDRTFKINQEPINQTFLIHYKDGSLKKLYTSLQLILADDNIVCAAIIEGDCYEAI